MTKLSKGKQTRMQILDMAREVFNAKGISITLNELASHAGLSISMITNHFRSRDQLFVAIAKEYELKYSQLMARHFPFQEITMQKLARSSSMLMDLQREYKCAILSVLFSSRSQELIYAQVVESYAKNATGMKFFIRQMLNEGLVGKEILNKNNFNAFNFQFVTLFTSWLAHLEIYDNDNGYILMKPVYLRGIMNCFLPYLTVSGRMEYQKLNFAAICKLAVLSSGSDLKNSGLKKQMP